MAAETQTEDPALEAAAWDLDPLVDGRAEAGLDELLGADGLDFARHYLRMERRYRPHLLSEPEEKLLAEKGVTGASAWGRLFSEHVSAIEVDGAPLDVALSRLQSSD